MLRTTKLVPDRRTEYGIHGMGRGALKAEADGDTVGYIAELDIGFDAPILGLLFDIIFQWIFPQRIEAMRQHMEEEGRNLKAILESGKVEIGEMDAAQQLAGTDRGFSGKPRESADRRPATVR